MHFNFFGYLTLTLHSNGHRGYQRYFQNEYARIDSPDSGTGQATSIHVHIVAELPDLQDGDLQRTVRVKNLFTFNYLIRNLSGSQVEIYFRRHWLDRLYMNAIAVFLQAQVIEPVMYLKLLESNVLFMHAAGVSRDGRGYLLPAHGGTGKTSFSMALLNQGFRLLGDDLLFVALDNGVVYPYPRPLHVFTYNINNLAGARIPLSYRARIYAKNAIRFLLERLLRTEFLISTRIHADQLFPDQPFGPAVPYTRLLFLRKSGAVIKTISIDEANRPGLVEEILNSADLNDSLYRILEEPEAIGAARSLERKVVTRLLTQLDTFSYVNPRQIGADELPAFADANF